MEEDIKKRFEELDELITKSLKLLEERIDIVHKALVTHLKEDHKKNKR